MDAMKGLSSETLEAIILQVQEYRLLWDKAQGDYKDHDLKEVTWNKIGQSVDLSGERVKKVWSNLRDTRTRYMREDSKILSSGSGSKRGKMDSWKWAKTLDFLSIAEYPKSTVSNILEMDQGGLEHESQSDVSIDEESEASSRPPSRASKQQEILSPKLTPGRRQKRLMPNDELETLYMSYLKKKQEKEEPEVDKDVEADKHWLLSLLPNFKGMPLNKKNRIKYEIQGLFLESDPQSFTRRDIPQQQQLHMQMAYQQASPQQQGYVFNQQAPFNNNSDTDSVQQSFDNDDCLYPTYTNL